jgi:hypothetical protein
MGPWRCQDRRRLFFRFSCRPTTTTSTGLVGFFSVVDLLPTWFWFIVVLAYTEYIDLSSRSIYLPLKNPQSIHPAPLGCPRAAARRGCGGGHRGANEMHRRDSDRPSKRSKRWGYPRPLLFRLDSRTRSVARRGKRKKMGEARLEIRGDVMYAWIDTPCLVT